MQGGLVIDIIGMQSLKCRRILVKVLTNQQANEQKYLELDVELGKGQDINLSQMLRDFVDRELIPLKSQVFYLDSVHKYFIFAGNFIEKEFRLPLKAVLINNALTLLVKKIRISDQALANPMQECKKRAKERTIHQVINSCREWRRLYHQGHKVQGQMEKITLDEAASHVGISRKTLEDYFKQLRDGCRFKFDFAKHRDQKMGVLRNYVKYHTKLSKPIEPKKPQSQIQAQTFHYIELSLSQQKEQPRLMYEEDIGVYLVPYENHIVNEDSSSSDENNSYQIQE